MFKVNVLIMFFLLSVSDCSVSTSPKTDVPKSPTPEKELKLIIPKATWEGIYFTGINKVSESDGLPRLRETVLPENDLEIRVWVGFGKYGLDGFILKRSSGNWSAIALKRMLCHLENSAKVNLQSSKSGWETTWQKLLEAEILTLPDSSKLNYRDGWLDGKSFVVEINHDYVYRTYEYGNPKHQEMKEAKQIVKIGEIIADEFGLESYSSATGGCGKND